MSKIATLIQIGRAFGARDGLLRLQYEWSRGAGVMSRRMRAVEGWEYWDRKRIAPNTTPGDLLSRLRRGDQPFFFSDCSGLAPELKRILGADGEPAAAAEACGVMQGNLPFFGRLAQAGGYPPNWFRNPMTGQSVARDRPWMSMRFASDDYGDLKFILELSRFLFVYPLARAYVLTGDERFPEAFWTAAEDWAGNSPPMSGPLWICGQECSLRILAWSFALHSFLHSPATTPARAALLLSMIAAHAWRTEQTIGYARSQRSNHLFSEAVGLWTAGTLFPELKDAARWQRRGASLLKEAVLDQITPEGVHLQYSFNYQRMVLHLLLWALRLSGLRQIALEPAIRSRTAAAFEYLRTFVDPLSGHAPNYGSNDGTNLIPLSGCEYGDFRPLMRLGACVLGHPRALASGLWDETALWFCGQTPSSPSVEVEPVADVSLSSGYHRLGSGRSWAMVRAGHYQRRPFQADQLHVDLWWDGINVARDAGTYLYNGPTPWNNALAGTAVHNTVMVDGRDQMRRAGRFLWLDWAQATGRSVRSEGADFSDRFEGEHRGYRRFGVTHRRTVQCAGEDAWIIVDDLLAAGEHELRLHWLVGDWPFELVSKSPLEVVFSPPQSRFRWNVYCSLPGTSEVVRAGKSLSGKSDDRNSILGWESPTYGELRPAVSLLYCVKASLPVRMVTAILAGDEPRVRLDQNQVVLHSGGLDREVSLVPDESTPGGA